MMALPLLKLRFQLSHIFEHKRRTMETKGIHLPNEIITTILSYHYHRKQFLIHTAGLVNKQWNNSMKHPSIWSKRSISIGEKNRVLSIPFIKECNITGFYIEEIAQAQFILNEFQSIAKKLEFSNQDWTEDDMAQLDFTPTLFPELEEFIFNCSNCDSIKKWLQFMPQLTILRITNSFDLDDEVIDGILSCKLLREISTAIVFDEMFTIRMFNELIHLEEVTIMFDGSVQSTIWDKVLQIPSVLYRLKTLEVIAYDTGLEEITKPTSIPQFKNLKALVVDGQLNRHSILLFSAQNTLETLNLNVGDVQVDFSGISFSKLKSITLYGANAKMVAELLASANNTLEYIEIRNTTTSSDVPSVYLNLPKLNELVMTNFPLSILSLILKDIERASLYYLDLFDVQDEATEIETQIVVQLFKRIHSLESYCGLPDFFKLIPEESLASHLDSLYIYTVDTDGLKQFTLDEQLFDRILKCSVLTTLTIETVSITVDNWIPRLFNACPQLSCLRIPNGKLEADMDLSQVEENEITSIQVHSSNLKAEDRLQFLETSKYIRDIEIYFIPTGQFSNVISELNKFDLKKVHLHVDNNGTDTLEKCELLTKKLPNSLKDVSINGQGPNVKFEDFLLMSLCTNLEGKVTSVNYSSSLNLETFFPAPYNVLEGMTKNHALSMTRAVLPDVIQRITGISEEKRQTILDSLLNNDEHPLLKEICRTIAYVEIGCNPWDERSLYI
jgi:hypothetical protein